MPESVCAEKQAGKEETEDSGKELIFDLVGRGDVVYWIGLSRAVRVITISQDLIILHGGSGGIHP